jgi:hypothetical protein
LATSSFIAAGAIALLMLPIGGTPLRAGPPPRPGAKPAAPPAGEAAAPAAESGSGTRSEDAAAGTGNETKPAAGDPIAAPADAPKPPSPDDQPVMDLFSQPPADLGFAGHGVFPRMGPPSLDNPATPVPDRWRIGWPAWDRYNRQTPADPILMNQSGGDSPHTRGHPLNPFDRNVLKGDYPIHTTQGGDEIFLNLNAISDTFFTYRRLPTPIGVSGADSNGFDFFGDGEQTFFSQTLLLPIEVFQGYSSFRPPDWVVRITPAVNFNNLELQENNAVNIDVREGDDRNDQYVALQEGFAELHLGDMSHHFDVSAVRFGRQVFVSDFRGFIYNDVGDGVRLFGNAQSNRIQYNLAFFTQNDKDTNSELSELNWRDQQVLIANAYIQDFIWLGYTTQFSFHWNHDQSDEEYDENGFLVIPDLIGDTQPHNIDAYYLGWASDGHIGRLNVNHAAYYVFGRDDHNPLAGRGVDISAYMAAVELSVDIDWFRPKASLLYASGDRDPTDGKAEGFDGIFDNPFFAGGPSSFYQSAALRLFGVNLTSNRSFYNDLAGTKAEGQSNYVNPGTILAGLGFDAEITPKLRTSFNANSIWFAQTEALEFMLNQNDIDQHVGYELNLVFQYRPFLNNNVIVTTGGSVFFPGAGFEDLFEDNQELFQVFTALTLTY